MIEKIVNQAELIKQAEIHRQKGGRIVFTNGCFDLLHVGHVRYLQAARDQGDLLILGLNSDVSVKTIKGSKRPVIPQDQRAEVLSALACVDYICLFDEPDPLRLIRAVRPDVLVKGADWREDEIIGADIVKADGGRIERITVVPGASTTDIIERVIKRYTYENEKGTEYGKLHQSS